MTRRRTGPAPPLRKRHLPVVRELVRAYQAFERFDSKLFHRRDLTPSQGDVVFTLGNTPGMTMKEIGERTLITKGTLTGVVDRLLAKGLVARYEHPEDKRCTLVALTPDGEELFERIFPRHLADLDERFEGVSDEELEAMHQALRRIRGLFPPI